MLSKSCTTVSLTNGKNQYILYKVELLIGFIASILLNFILKSFCSETIEDKTARNIFLDAVAIAGTNPNIKFLIDLIQKKEIVGERAAEILMTLPMYIRTPTKELLNEYFVSPDSDSKNTSYMSSFEFS